MIFKKHILMFILLLTTQCVSGQSTFKKYFFGSKDFYKTNNELVIIVDNPQTEFAKRLGSRFYDDTSFIKKISNDFFTEVDSSIHDIETHYCGYDLFFYSKRNNNLKLIKAINSKCDMKEEGLIDEKNQCKNLETLESSGYPLIIDSLFTTTTTEKKDSLVKDLIYFQYLIASENSRPAQLFYWTGCNNSTNLPIWYYDGYIDLTLSVDISKTLEENMVNYLNTIGIDSVDYQTINWQFESNIAQNFSFYQAMNHPVPKDIKVRFYLNKELYGKFEIDAINSNSTENWVDFSNSNRYILLYKLP